MSRGRGPLGWLMFWILSGQLGCIGTVVAIIVLTFVIYLLALVAYQVGRLLLAIGLLFGAGITIRNYASALYHNIKPERATP